jgi:hypothetical protein
MRSIHLEDLSRLKMEHLAALEQERAKADEQVSYYKSQLKATEEEAQCLRETTDEKISSE